MDTPHTILTWSGARAVGGAGDGNDSMLAVIPCR